MIRILLFGEIKERLGRDTIMIDSSGPVSIETLNAMVLGDNGRELVKSSHFLYAINQQHALPQDTVRDGDEVAIMPPFAGG